MALSVADRWCRRGLEERAAEYVVIRPPRELGILRDEGRHVGEVLVLDLLAELVHLRALAVTAHGADHVEVDRPEVDDRRTHFSGGEETETAGEPAVREAHRTEPNVPAGGAADDPGDLPLRPE